MTITLSGVLSAFLINDIVCLALTPLVLHLARRLRFDPVPHLIALATAANIGSTGTITGNPQNIYIGSHSGIPYFRFAARLMPVAALGLAINFAVIVLVYRRQLATTAGAAGKSPAEALAADRKGTRRSQVRFRVLQWKSGLVALATLALFFTGLPLELVALGAAAVLLLSRIKPEHIYRQIDWSLLVMFTGLFVVVHAFQLHIVDHWGIEHWDGLLSRPVGLLSLVATLLSNLVSNVPAVLLMEPVLKAIPAASRETAWLDTGHVEHAGRQPYRAGLGGQPDRAGRRSSRGRAGFLLGILQGRRAGYDPDPGAGHRLAAVRALLEEDQSQPQAAAQGPDMPRKGCGIRHRKRKGPEPVLRNWCTSCGAT